MEMTKGEAFGTSADENRQYVAGARESSVGKRKHPDSASEDPSTTSLDRQEKDGIADPEIQPVKRPRGRPRKPPQPKPPPKKRGRPPKPKPPKPTPALRPSKYSDEGIEALKEEARQARALRNGTTAVTPLFTSLAGSHESQGPPYENVEQDSDFGRQEDEEQSQSNDDTEEEGSSHGGHDDDFAYRAYDHFHLPVEGDGATMDMDIEDQEDTGGIPRVLNQVSQPSAPARNAFADTLGAHYFKGDTSVATLEEYDARDTTTMLKHLRDIFQPKSKLWSAEDEEHLERDLERAQRSGRMRAWLDASRDQISELWTVSMRRHHMPPDTIISPSWAFLDVDMDSQLAEMGHVGQNWASLPPSQIFKTLWSKKLCVALEGMFRHPLSLRDSIAALQYAVITRTDDRRDWPLDVKETPVLKLLKNMVAKNNGRVPIRALHASAVKEAGNESETDPLSSVFMAIESLVTSPATQSHALGGCVTHDKPYMLKTTDVLVLLRALDISLSLPPKKGYWAWREYMRGGLKERRPSHSDFEPTAEQLDEVRVGSAMEEIRRTTSKLRQGGRVESFLA